MYIWMRGARLLDGEPGLGERLDVEELRGDVPSVRGHRPAGQLLVSVKEAMNVNRRRRQQASAVDS